MIVVAIIALAAFTYSLVATFVVGMDDQDRLVRATIIPNLVFLFAALALAILVIL